MLKTIKAYTPGGISLIEGKEYIGISVDTKPTGCKRFKGWCVRPTKDNTQEFAVQTEVDAILVRA